MLANQQKKRLKALAQKRKPVVIIGNNGLTQAVLDEISNAISHHELIKVKIKADDRIIRMQIIEQISATLQAELVQRIGHMAIFFKPKPTSA